LAKNLLNRPDGFDSAPTAIVNPADSNRVMGALMNYLQANPDACDDIQGVTDWWLGSTDLVATREIVEHVLRKLGDDGRVRITRSLSGKILYSRGPAT
jgi:hypothetical protein